MQNTALITGASSGIGEELARVHAAAGGDLVLVARREERLDKLAEELSEEHGVECLVLARDLVPAGAAEALYAELAERGVEVDYLINNAGFGGHGLFYERAWEDDRAMIQLNVLALTALTRAALPAMVERGRGRVLNVASMAGFLPGPYQAVYYATKAFVQSFSQAVDSELAGTGVTVTALCPGLTDTEFIDRADLGGSRFVKTSFAASARQVAEAGYRAMLGGDAVIVPGLLNKATMGIMRFAPRGILTRVSKMTMEKA